MPLERLHFCLRDAILCSCRTEKKYRPTRASEWVPGEGTRGVVVRVVRGIEERPAFLFSITACAVVLPSSGRNPRCTLSSIALIALLLVFDGLCFQLAAGSASRGGAWGLLDNLVPAAVVVYYSGAHGGVGGCSGGRDGGWVGGWWWWGSLELFLEGGLGGGNSRALEWRANAGRRVAGNCCAGAGEGEGGEESWGD